MSKETAETFARSENVQTKRENVCMTPALRHWLWLNFGFDQYDWADDEIRF